MDKQVLMFFPHRLKQRHGGPYSMLYHLQQGLQSYDHPVAFLSDRATFDEQPASTATNAFATLKKIVTRMLPKKVVANYRINQWIKAVSVPPPIPLNRSSVHSYKILHFHETIDLWRYRELLSDYKGKIVLTSHTPKPYHLELLEDVMNLTKYEISLYNYKRLEAIDLYAYQKADELIFPCREATEPYLYCWPLFAAILRAKPVSFIATGVVASVISKNEILTRQELQLSADAFVVTYVGRKTAVKGYDLLVRAAEQLMALHDDLYFIIVGKKDDTVSRHPRWIETGWTDDPFSYVGAGNLHVVPNRCTNFDLNVLEVLSLGRPLLLSDTGGNKIFKQFGSDAVFYHEPSVDSLMLCLEQAYQMRDVLKNSGEDNKKIYQNYFTAERFAKAQLDFYNSIL